jgi:hypothetical protein
MRTILKELVLQRGFEIAESRFGEAAQLVNVRPGVADRNTEILGDPFR